MELKIDTGLVVNHTTLLPDTEGFCYHFTLEAGGKVFTCSSFMGNEKAMNASLKKVQTALETGEVKVHPAHIPIDKK